MGCYENREMRRLRTGFFLMAAVVFVTGLLLLMAEQGACQASFERAIYELYGEDRSAELLAFVGHRSDRNLWLFAGCTAACFAAYFFFMTEILSKICGEIRRFSLCLEQMTAGRPVSLAEWKEGILAALSNQAELLYLRNGHMVELVQKEKEAVCRFTENMVHQMKTPLTALRLDLDLMEAKLSGKGASQTAVLKKLEDCQVQCDKLQESVDEFLTASRFSAGKLRLVLTPAKMKDIVEGALRELATVLEKRKIYVRLSEESELSIYCDCNWMRAAVANVLKNSAEAMAAGGTIEICCRSEGQWIFLELTDEGGGLSEETGRHLFERFYTGRQGEGGTGLGLAIAREVVEASHGTIEAIPVSGRPGRRDGTKFLMRFRILSGPEAYVG